MKQIVVISGKGGTGKTVLTGAFAAIANNHVMADCDVDAADLHLLLHPKIIEQHVFKCGVTAKIDPMKCIHCYECVKHCRFNAIDQDLNVDPIACEGCKFCYHLCPVGAIDLIENTSGEWFVSETQSGPFVHAKLGIAEENSGKLVSLIRQKASDLAIEQNKEMVIIDGAPGIGCPVVACISNTDCAVVVTEPTLSGAHDAKRVIQVARHFNVPIKVVINKFDLNKEISQDIEDYCETNEIDLAGKIEFDKDVVKSIVEGKTIMETTNSKLKKSVEEIWVNINNEGK